MNRLYVMLYALVLLFITVLACVLYFIIWTIFFCFFVFMAEDDFWITFEKFWKAIPKPVNEDIN